MKTAFLFSGQGSQVVGMGKDLYEEYEVVKKIIDDVTLDFDLKQVMFEGPSDLLDDTSYAQPCIFVLSTAIAALLNSMQIQCDVCAGLSLGEYSAYAHAKTFSIQEGAELTRKRGKLMATALPKGTSAMAAILMLSQNDVKLACEKAQKNTGKICEIANFNCPGQIVITGEKEAVEEAMEYCKELGARRCMPLNVSGAFHSSLLKDASKELGVVLEKCTLSNPDLPVYNNISGKCENGSIQEILMKQMYSSVYFEQTILQMYQDGVRRFVEIGPGKTISSFVKKICKDQSDIQILHVEDCKSLKQLENVWKESSI